VDEPILGFRSVTARAAQALAFLCHVVTFTKESRAYSTVSLICMINTSWCDHNIHWVLYVKRGEVVDAMQSVTAGG
jgi:hypothetical protein